MKSKLTLLFKKPVIIIFLISAFPLQEILAQKKPDFIIGIDVQQYRDKVEQNYLELYYTYKQSLLTYKSKGDAFEGAIIMSITLSSNESDSVLLNKKIRIPSLVADTASTDQDRSLVGMLNMFVPNLNQNMSIKSVDENDESRTHTFTLELPSKSFFSNSVAISDIELASTIRKTQNGKKSRNIKRNYQCSAY